MNTMSFPPDPMIIQPEEILESDIIIEDQKLVALGGNESATQASNTAAKASFYSKLIVSFADSIRSKEKTDESEWTLDAYKLATEKIINIMSKAKSSETKRFIWLRQFPEKHYVVMTRTQTINKLANDLDCQMRKVKARELAETREANKKKPNQRRYAQRLIFKVCRAARRDMSSYQAALLLDQPDIKMQGSNRIPSDGLKDQKEGVAALVEERHDHESESERSLRLQLRHRFLTCVRSKKCIFEFANALLSMWGLPNISKIAPKLKKRKKHGDATSKTSPKSAYNTKEDKVQRVVEPHNVGTWNRAERAAFLEGYEKHGVPNWVRIAPYVSTRTKTQVTAFGRTVVKKFNLEHGDRGEHINVREFLLREDDVGASQEK